MQGQPIKKSFFSASKTSTLHHTQTNVQQPFLNTACYCELAAKQPISETSQSCVSSTASLSHRFKSSPAIPGKLAMPGAAGYMMNAGHFCENYESSGDLNRPRSPEVRKPLACFLVLFARRKKNVKTSPLQGASRFCKPQISAPQWQLRTATIKTFFRKLRGSANLDSAHKDNNFVQSN